MVGEDFAHETRELYNGININENEYEKRVEMHLAVVLHDAIWRGFENIVKMMLRKEASMTLKVLLQELYEEDDEDSMGCEHEYVGPWNALELAILVQYVVPQDNPSSLNIFKLLEKTYLDKYTSHGLSPIHTASASGNLVEIKSLIEKNTEIINAKISDNSPVWPGMTPLLLAAKFNRQDVIAALLDLGASPEARDDLGNTPLHFLSIYETYDESYKRLFLFDNNDDTFSLLTGKSHFHIACQYCPETLDIVESYLKNGVSPNLRMIKTQKNFYKTYYIHGENDAGLHIATRTRFEGKESIQCHLLGSLLIEYGADIDQRTHGYSFHTALDMCVGTNSKLSCILIESGAIVNFEKRYFKAIEDLSLDLPLWAKCIKKMILLNPNNASRMQKDLKKYLKKCNIVNIGKLSSSPMLVLKN